MTYKELQAKLKEYKLQGLTEIKLNSKHELLQQEYDRINKKPDLHYARTKVATYSSEELQQYVYEASLPGFTTDEFGMTIIEMMKDELQMRSIGKSFIKIEIFSVSSDNQENTNMNKQISQENTNISQEQAKYRVSIKRELRKLNYRDFDNEDPTEILEAKLLEAKKKTKGTETKATEYVRKMAAIYNPIKAEMQKVVNNMTLQEYMKICKDNNIHHKDLVDFLAKRKAIPLWKQAGLA